MAQLIRHFTNGVEQAFTLYDAADAAGGAQKSALIANVDGIDRYVALTETNTRLGLVFGKKQADDSIKEFYILQKVESSSGGEDISAGTINISFAPNNMPSFTIPAGVNVLAVTPSGADTVYVGVTPGKTYSMYIFQGNAGGSIKNQMFNLNSNVYWVTYDASIDTGSIAYSKEINQKTPTVTDY